MCASQEYSPTVFEKLHAKSKIRTMENHLTLYLTNETSFQESWIERFALIIIMTIYYLFDIVNVTRKEYVMVVNEEKQKMKQQSLFGGIVKHNTKFYCICKYPDGDFEPVVEQFRYHIPKGGTISLQYSNILPDCKITVNFFCLSPVQRLYQVKTSCFNCNYVQLVQ